MWATLAGKKFNDKAVKKKKWLYTVWHSDSKFTRTRALLRQMKINLFAFRNYENEKNYAQTESDWGVIRESDTEEKALEEMPPKNEDVKNRDTISEIKETHQEKGQDETEIFQKETTVDPSTAEKSAESVDSQLTRDYRNTSHNTESVDGEDIAQTWERDQSAENGEHDKNIMCRDRLHCGKGFEHNPENEDAQNAMIRNTEIDVRVNGYDEYMVVRKEEEKIEEHMEEVVKETHEDKVIIISEGSEDEVESIEENSIECSDDTVFCVCKQPNNPTEPYAQCSLCKDWFHPVCVGYQSVEDIAAISPWYCPSCSTDTNATDTGQKDKIKRRLSFGRELPSCPQKFSVSLTREEWSAIHPDDRDGYRVLRKGWTDIISSKTGTVNKFLCPFIQE